MGQAWTSARLTTRGKVSFVYGKIEFRAKIPTGDGTWAAGWLLGDAYRDEISWPYCGEVDILECVGREIDNTIPIRLSGIRTAFTPISMVKNIIRTTNSTVNGNGRSTIRKT
jgi:beta-glucanase (GH16 family)